MMPKKSRGAKTFPFQLMEVSMAAPQVIAYRLLQMVMAGPLPSVRDNKELVRMWLEKAAAYNESCSTIAHEMILYQQKIWVSSLHQWFVLWTTGSLRPWHRQNNTFWENILSRGLSPIHRRTVANAQRLQRRSHK